LNIGAQGWECKSQKALKPTSNKDQGAEMKNRFKSPVKPCLMPGLARNYIC
jgi:hypothetical protein